MSKPSDEWATPPEIFEWGCKVFGKNPRQVYVEWTDIAATKENRKCADYFTLEHQYFDWPGGPEGDQIWCNPPYSNSAPFIEACAKAAEAIMLLKCDPSTKNFKFCVENAQEIVLMNFRVRFVGAPNVANFPTMAVYFNKSMPKRGARIWSANKQGEKV
jgi:phage N-6-adenine-methyltransferase